MASGAAGSRTTMATMTIQKGGGMEEEDKDDYDKLTMVASRGSGKQLVVGGDNNDDRQQ